MTIIQIFCLIILLLIILFSFKKNVDLFSPARTFGILWCSLIIVTEFKFSGYQHSWSSLSWIVLFIGLFSFLTGIYISYVMQADAPLLTLNQIRDRIKETRNSYNRDNLYYIILTLSVIYVFSLVVEILVEGYIPLFHPKPDIVRVNFGLFGVHLFVNQMPVILFLIVEFFILQKGSGFRKLIASILFVTVFISFFFLMQRFSYFYFIVMTFGLLYYSTRLMNLRNTVILLGSFLGFLFWLTSIRLSQYAAQFYYVTSKMNYSPKYASFTGVYMYLVMNLENFARGVMKLDNFTYSAMTLDWVYALTGLKHWMKDYFGYVYNPYLNSGYTTFPFIWDYYIDFGLIGITLFPIVTGYFTGMIYYNMRTRGTIESVVAYSFVLFLLIISFFTNPLTMLSIVSNIAVLWAVHRFFIRKKIPANDGAGLQI